MIILTPAHGILESTRKFEVRAVLGEWQQSKCAKLDIHQVFPPHDKYKGQVGSRDGVRARDSVYIYEAGNCLDHRGP